MQMHKLLLVIALVFGLSLTTAMAQDKRFELIPFIGFTASSGVDIQNQDIGDGRIINYLAPKSSG